MRDQDCMKARIVEIGHSQGIRIPKSLLQHLGHAREVNISVRDDSLVIQPVSRPRAGWSEAFQQMSERGDDQLLDGDDPGSQ